MDLRIISRLLFDVAMFTPIREIPLAEGFLCQLGKFSVANPRIETTVVEQKVRCIRHGWLGCLFNDMVLLGVTEHMSRKRE